MTLFVGPAQRQNIYVQLSSAFAKMTQSLMAPIWAVFTLQFTYRDYFIDSLSV